MKTKNFIVITTINERTKAIDSFARLKDWKIVLVGDKKSKHIETADNVIFLSVDDQLGLGYELATLCPYNHYARKNIGYLYAIENGAQIIVDTDDDNIPYDSWSIFDFHGNKIIKSSQRFYNAYTYFTDEKIWPRGLPLRDISRKQLMNIVELDGSIEVGVWQGLADRDPDVDAIYRLVLSKEVKFRNEESIALDKHVYCPFNSQNTTWSRKAFPLMYLPATVSFRFTDILRGYIAQRLLWSNNMYLGFTKATVFQERNEHDLMKDFLDEIECYTNTEGIVDLLESMDLSGDLCADIDQTYAVLAQNKFLEERDLELLRAWLRDIGKVTRNIK